MFLFELKLGMGNGIFDGLLNVHIVDMWRLEH